ncbi:hypothetical protein BOX15_Mlig032911g2, partial [Macrostomum lignano]
NSISKSTRSSRSRSTLRNSHGFVSLIDSDSADEVDPSTLEPQQRIVTVRPKAEIIDLTAATAVPEGSDDCIVISDSESDNELANNADDGEEAARRTADSLVWIDLDANELESDTDDDDDLIVVAATPPATRQMKPTLPAKRKLLYCQICKSNFSDPIRTHQASIAHQLALMPDEAAAPASGSAADRKLCVASGPAYRMMLKQGWTPGSGLGRHGQGRSQPIATVVKRDRLGLGMAAPKKQKKQIPQSNNSSAAEPTGSGCKANFERDFRRYMNDPDSTAWF